MKATHSLIIIQKSNYSLKRDMTSTLEREEKEERKGKGLKETMLPLLARPKYMCPGVSWT